jgi:hypothetical protein
MVPVEIGHCSNVSNMVQNDVILRALTLFYLFFVVLSIEVTSLDVPKDKAVTRGGHVPRAKRTELYALYFCFVATKCTGYRTLSCSGVVCLR